MSTIREVRELTPEYLLGLATPNSEFEEITRKTPIGPLAAPETDVASLRAYLQSLKEKLNASVASTGPVSYIEEDIQIPVRDGTTIPIRVHSPRSQPKDGSPLFVVYHGGGFVLGGLDNETVLCRKWVELGGVAVNVDYRLAPEHPFPVPVQDAFDALKWAAEHTVELKVNAAKGFLVGGISAGGNFAAIVSHLYTDEGLQPPLTGSWLSIPATMLPEVVPEDYKTLYLSREQNKHAPLLDEGALKFFELQYKPDNRSSLRSPYLFENRARLPPTYFQVCGLDPLRDEGLIYEELLRRAGVKTKLDIYPGLPHSFWSICPQAEFSREFQNDCTKAMKWFLEMSG